MRKIKVLTLCLAILLISGSFYGCTEPTQPVEPSNTTASQNITTTVNETEKLYYNETGYPIVNEPITVKIMGIDFSDPRRKWIDNKFFKRMEELTNIRFEYTQLPVESWGEKKSVYFAGGDYGDVFFKLPIGQDEETSLAEQGIIIPLEGYLEKNAPALSALLAEKPDIKRAITLNSGHIVSLPFLSQNGDVGPGIVFYYNKKWADNLGIAEPTSLEAFYDMLVAFKERDPNGNNKTDEIPMTFLASTDMSAIKSFLANFGLLFNDANLFIDNGQAIFSPTQPQFKEGLLYLKKLYDEKLLDNEIFTQNAEQRNAKSSGADNLVGVIYDLAPFLQVGEGRNLDYQSMIPFATANGKQIYSGGRGLAGAVFAITKNCQYPEAMVRWADYLYTDEGGTLALYGKEGEEWAYNNDGTWDYLIKEGQEINDVTYPGTIQGAWYPPGRQDMKFYSKINDANERSFIGFMDRIKPFAIEPFPRVYVSDAKNKELAGIKADVNAYVEQMIARFITGDADLEKDWDQYIARLEQMGANKLVEEHQKLYDEYMNK